MNMKQSRLEQLADGIFAIVMTILVFEIKVPEYIGVVSNQTLFNSIIDIYPAFLSYLLSFSLLFSYWRSHHFIASVLAKNIDTRFSNLNGMFFFFVALVPFSAHFLARYIDSQVTVFVFALNIVLIGIALYRMRNYVVKAETIDNMPFTDTENKHAKMHILFPVISAIAAVVVSFFSISLAILLFTLAILFNLSNKSSKIIFGVVDLFRKKEEVSVSK